MAKARGRLESLHGKAKNDASQNEADKGKVAMIHVVQPGDTLSALARRYKTSVSAFMAANPIIKNPDLIVVGWNLRVPGTSSGGATGSWGGSQPSPTLVSSGGKSDWLVYGALGVAGFFIGKSMKWW